MAKLFYVTDEKEYLLFYEWRELGMERSLDLSQVLVILVISVIDIYKIHYICLTPR